MRDECACGKCQLYVTKMETRKPINDSPRSEVTAESDPAMIARALRIAGSGQNSMKENTA
ncbi:MAG: hypothetical protein IH987_17300 [Planctomycetes bacterium]|nr:hypothetical protein [Planctomycetota bacterium]